MHSLGCKLIIAGWVVHLWLLNNTCFVWLEALTALVVVNNPINIFLINLKNYFVLFLIIKYWLILRMSSFLIEYDELKNHTQYHLKSVRF